jgi:outer membrane protein assembly factor BamB
LNYVGASDQVEGGVMALWNKELTKHYAFSTETGNFLWETDSEHWLDAYGWGNAEHTWYFAYGKLISVGVGGVVYGYDAATGNTDWTYNMTDPYNEPVTGDNWWGWITMIADEKVYIGTVEHSAEMPLPRGGPLICLNATTGEEIWRVNGMFRATRWGGNGVMGDSIMATMDTYDQRVYAVGKGPSETTVTASPKVTIFGSSVQIEGMVTDISPGTSSDILALRFPNGVPAVSDASMSEWMLHVYKQFALPSHGTTGVPVALSVVDSNGNYREIGTTTTNDGYFSFNWKPDIAGQYTVYASFGGSAAYYASHAITSFAVDSAHPTAAPTETPPQSPADMYFAPAIAGLFVLIIVVAIVLALLMLRKRP